MFIDGFSGFGLFTLVTNFIGYAGWKSKQRRINKKLFKLTYDPKKNTYLDMYCVERRPNGDYCKTKRNRNGDLIQEDIHGNVVRNFSQEKRDKINSSSETTVLKMSDEDLTVSTYTNPVPKGIKYIDKKTKEEYVIRCFFVPVSEKKRYYVYFYMRTSDGTLVRTTDGENKYGHLKDRDIIDQFIQEFNQNQKTKRFFTAEQKYWDNYSSWGDRELSRTI